MRAGNEAAPRTSAGDSKLSPELHGSPVPLWHAIIPLRGGRLSLTGVTNVSERGWRRFSGIRQRYNSHMVTLRRGLGATSYDSLVTSLASQFNVPPSLALAIMNAESAGNPTAVSSAGAQGLFQVMPANDASLGITNPFDPTQNATGGLSLLQGYYNQYGNWTQALEAYNEGPGNLNSQISAGVTPTSQGYATSILAAAGISDSSAAAPSMPVISDDSASQGDSTDFLGSLGLPDLSDLSGVSWALIAMGVVGVVWAFSR